MSGHSLYTLGLLSLVLTFSASASAHDGDVDAVRSIDELYFHRDVAGNLDKSIVETSANVERVEKFKEAEHDGLPLFLWLRCRSLVGRGDKREKKSEKLADYDSARQDCEKSVKLNPNAADAHFWFGISMGRWGEAKGMMKAMFLIKPIRKEMAETLRLDPKQGGAHRVLGEMLWQIPGFAGGDKKQALVEYEAAVKMSPDHSTNYQPLAEAYVYFDRKDDAIKTLKAVAEIKNPADPSDYPGDLADSKKLLEKLTKK